MSSEGLREICEHRPALGAWTSLPSPLAAEALGLEGFDYVCIDCQHGLIDDGEAVAMLQALSGTGAAGVQRVLSNDPGRIGRALDTGAEAVIVPMVESPEAAAAAARACRYAPVGTRSFGPTRSSLYFGPDPVAANQRVLCLVMIETKAGMERADEILGTPGVDGVYIGPRDLAISLGLDPTDASYHAPEHDEAVRHILAACHRAGVIPGIHAGTGANARRYLELGFRFLTVAMDLNGLRAAARDELRVAREQG